MPDMYEYGATQIRGANPRQHTWVAGHQFNTGQIVTEGRNKTETKDRHLRAIERFVTEYREPEVIAFNGVYAVMYVTTPHDTEPVYGYRFLHEGRVGGSSVCGDSWDEMERYARHHVAQMGCDDLDDESVRLAAKFAAKTDSLGYSKWPDAEREFYRRAAWQRAARHAIDAGIEDYHGWACDHDKDPEFQINVKETAAA